jgi:hypothetical protein
VTCARCVTATMLSLMVCRHIQRFELQYRPAEGGEGAWISISSTIKSSKWTVVDLRPDSGYVFRVKFRKFGGWSLFSEPYAQGVFAVVHSARIMSCFRYSRSVVMQTEALRTLVPSPPLPVSVTTTSVSLMWPALPTLVPSVTVYCSDLGSAALWLPRLTDAHTTVASQVFSAQELPHAPVDDDTMIYSGSLVGCVAVNLKPHRAYGFRMVFDTEQSSSEVSHYRFVAFVSTPRVSC